MRWLLPLTLGLISAGFIIFTGHISVSFVLDRFGNDPFWIILSVAAIAIEVLGAVAIAELVRRKRFVTAMLGVPFLALAVAATVSFEIGKFAQASSDAIAHRQFEADAFEGNRQALADLRRKRDTALKKRWTKTAAKYQASIDRLKGWASGTTIRDVDPRAAIVAKYLGLDRSLTNDGMIGLIILFLLMGRTVTPYWAYCLLSDVQRTQISATAPAQANEYFAQDKEHPKEWSAQESVRFFVNRKTQSVKGSRAGATDLYRSYCMFATNNRLPWLQQKDFGETLGSMGLKKGRKPGNGAITYLDIELAEAA